MTLRRRFHALLVLAIASMPCLASAFFLGPFVQQPAMVEEYYNVHLAHYFYAYSGSDDAVSIAAGRAGPGWEKTGLTFQAYASFEAINPGYLRPDCERAAEPCVAVSRFYSPGTNSHFFTGNALETEMLRQPGTGWLYEKTAFVMPLPNAAGQCGERLTPIYRLYNNLFATHRFTPSSDARARLIAAGWRDEGIGFCAYAAFPIRTSLASLQPNLVRGVQSWADCHVPTILGGCIGVFNVPVPSVRYPGPSSPEFDIRTGVPPNPSGYEAFAVPASSPAAAASDVFVQSVPFGSFAAMHLSTLSKGPSPWSSMAMVATAEGPPPKYPFRIRAGTAYELTIGLDMKLQRLEAAAGSHAYGNALLEFVDSKSGRAIRFNLLAFGTLPGGDGAGVDVKDGVTIVGTTFRPGSAFGRSTAASVRATSSSYRASTDGLDRFEYKIVRPEFAAILAAARKVDPALSAEPDDYFVLRFGILLEVYGEGEIGGFFIPAQFSVQPL